MPFVFLPRCFCLLGNTDEGLKNVAYDCVVESGALSGSCQRVVPTLEVGTRKSMFVSPRLVMVMVVGPFSSDPNLSCKRWKLEDGVLSPGHRRRPPKCALLLLFLPFGP